MNERNAYGLDEQDVADDMGFSTLHRAIVLACHSLHLNDDLLQQEFHDVNRPDRVGRTPLHWACISGDSVAVQLLLQWRANTDLTDNAGKSALHYASNSGDASCVTAMLDAGAAATATDERSATSLLYLRDSNAYVVSSMIAHGANVNHRNFEGWTALHHAAQAGQALVVRQLIRAGADPFIRDHAGQLPIHRAVQYDRADALNFLLRHYSDVIVSAVICRGTST